ncbi:Nn.00g017800.m01.CDS01 [Neocucurbitaria sp. VM-36]
MPARSGTSASSMHTATSFSSSFLESSPSRQSPTRNAVRPHRASLVQDPYESPSRQMALEFNLRLSISDRDFNDKLDQAAAERAKLHAEQLARAAEEHERVRRGAELELQRLVLEEEQAKLRREEAQRREVERLKQEKAREEAEAHRRGLEAKRREEETARQAAEHQRQIQETEARLKAQKEQEAAAERQKKEKVDADRKAAEAAATAEKARAQQIAQQPAPQTTSTSTAPTTTTTATTTVSKPSTTTQAHSADVEQIHAKYLELHLRMKQFRIAFWNEHKKPQSPLKQPVGDARRALRTRLGQINVERKDSVAAIKRLREECFDMALNSRGPMIDIRPYIISHQIPPIANEAEAAYPAFLLYVWICFEKFLLKQFEKEAANEDGRIIQEIGLIAASLLGDQKYMWKGIPLTDIVLAKLHRACPPLFGVRGTMTTAEGRLRLGWLPTSTLDAYNQRLRGVGAGYAAMSLRTFSSKAPALPISEYWRAIVSICNTPPEHLWPGHFAILNGLLRDYYKKFLSLYGVPARGVLRRATIDLPARAPERCKDAAGTVSVLPEGWKKERIFLD